MTPLTPPPTSDPVVHGEPVEGVPHDVQLMAQVLHDGGDAAGVLQHVHALGVRVVAHRERPPDGLGKLPVGGVYRGETFMCLFSFGTPHPKPHEHD